MGTRALLAFYGSTPAYQPAPIGLDTLGAIIDELGG
ncbi:hypothetical protein MHAE_07284 [Mycobacterium haemophilum DSM 44634]